MRKLPRKVDVLEGENAAFCVEVEKEEMDVHWYKEGMELRETHQTIIKSFGRTHILVFVNTMPQDAGVVTFLVGRSKTSSQLRVKGRKSHQPDSRTSSFLVAFGSDQHLLFYTSCWFCFFWFQLPDIVHPAVQLPCRSTQNVQTLHFYHGFLLRTPGKILHQDMCSNDRKWAPVHRNGCSA